MAPSDTIAAPWPVEQNRTTGRDLAVLSLPRPVHFQGVPIHALTMEDTLGYVRVAMRHNEPLRHVAMNVAKFVKLRDDPELRNDVLDADLIGVDGMGILIGARLLGIRIPERVAGVDLMEKVLALCAEDGFRPFFLGATQQVLDLAIANLAKRHPSLQIAGAQHGYFDRAGERRIVEEINAAKPDCLFVGMPTPRKERFMAEHGGELRVPFVMGVGGGIDILAGHVRRAPEAWQRSGFEWLYRTLQEPRRMWRRYLVTNSAYAMILAGGLVQRVALRPHTKAGLSRSAPDA
jgi:N-acetylglucosaminyldiphosphoundecaprenol N-acetyl-beta-D-mannosaminyltransferase